MSYNGRKFSWPLTQRIFREINKIISQRIIKFVWFIEKFGLRHTFCFIPETLTEYLMKEFVAFSVLHLISPFDGFASI